MTKPWFEEATELLAKATPGPWEWNAADGSINDVKDGEWVAFAEPCGDMNSRIVAEPYDALLIAAAPTLLKAALEEREGHQARWQSDAKWIAELSEERDELLGQAALEAAQERMRIVAWLRRGDAPQIERYSDDYLRVMDDLASAIAAGQHLHLKSKDS